MSEIAGFRLTEATPISLNGDINAHFAITTAAANLWTISGADDWIGRPVLADDGTNWIALYRSGTSHTAAGKFHLRFSVDDGATWTNEDAFIGGGAVSGPPTTLHGSNTNMTDGIVLVAPNGELLIHVYENGSTDRGTYQYRSDDDGATWTDEGRINDDATIISGQDYTIVGTDIYLACMEDPNGDGNNPYTAVVYKSTNNGTGWAKIGTIESDTTYGNEPGIIHAGGNNLLCVMRDAAEATTYQYTSSDLGVSWSARESITGMGVFQRARMKALAGGILLFGREGTMTIGGVYTCVWYSADNGTTWGRKFRPDTSVFSDAGYCDVLERADGKFYLLTYGGSTSAAVIRSAVFEIA